MKHISFSILIVMVCMFNQLLGQDTYKILRIENASSITAGNHLKKSGDYFKETDILVFPSYRVSILAQLMGTSSTYCFSKAAMDAKKAKTIKEYFDKNRKIVPGAGRDRGVYNPVPTVCYGKRDANKYPEKRIALVIGNSNYKKMNVLQNPINDARDVSNRLNQLGFDVATLFDGDLSDMNSTISSFFNFAQSYQVALIYFAGHGIRYNGKDYLLSTDRGDMTITDECSLESLVTQSERWKGENKVMIFVIDACRKNASFDIDYHAIEANKGTVIIQSTASDEIALDGFGSSGNSPFASSFINGIGKPNEDIEEEFFAIRKEVIRLTKDKQRPRTSFGGSYHFSFCNECGHVDGGKRNTNKEQSTLLSVPNSLKEIEERLSKLDKIMGEDYLGPFPTESNDKWGYMYYNGELFVPYQYGHACLFSEGLAGVMDSSIGKYGFIDKSGMLISPYKWTSIGGYFEGLSSVKDSNGKWGFVDKAGKMVIPCMWEDAHHFSEGLSAVKYNNGMWGFIDKSGQVIIPCKWLSAGYFSDGLAGVMDSNSKCGFINKKGNMTIPCKWKGVYGFSEGLSRVIDSNGKQGFIDKKGKVIIPCIWEEALDLSDGIVRVKDSRGKWGCLDKTGNTIIPCTWKIIYKFSEGLATVKDSNGKWGFIDKKGKLIIPCKWEFLHDFSEGLAAVKDSNGKWGFIDKTGKMVVPCIWEDARAFYEGLAIVKDSNNRYGIVNKSGKLVTQCEWTFAYESSEGLICVRDSYGFWGCVDKIGRIVVPCQWKVVYPFSGGRATVIDSNDNWHIIDRTGKILE